MVKAKRAQPFAQVLRDVEGELAASTRPKLKPGLHDDCFVDQTGVEYAICEEEITADRAHDLAAAGAIVVWDPCGCGGFCGFTWFAPDDVAVMVRSGPPTIRNNKRSSALISEWRSDAGETLLLANQDVRWADLLA